MENTVSSPSVPLSHALRRRAGAPRAPTVTVGASYARYSSDLQDESSIPDQQRQCRDRAAELQIEIPPSCEYSDQAVSGTKRNRVGLTRLLVDAEQRRFHVLFFFSLSRLARESVISMPLLKELVHVHHVRVISLTEGIDSQREGWELQATLLSLFHEQYLKDLRANVLRGLEGTLLARFSLGDLRFGYTSRPSPGGELIGHGPKARPRRVYAIDEDQAEVVRQVFAWFVGERWSIRQIAAELNRRQIDKDHRATTSVWRQQHVVGLLRSPKYLGLWPWGLRRNVRHPTSGQILQEPREEAQTRKWVREFPELRIVADDLWGQAQVLLDANCERVGSHRRVRGQLGGSLPERGRGHLLSRLLQCRTCGSYLHAGGSRGKYLFCPGHQAGLCPCRAHLPRRVAERQILGAVGRAILATAPWREAVQAAAQRAWRQSEACPPREQRRVQAAVEDCDRRIRRLVDLLEASDHPDPALGQRLAERRQERAHWEQQLAASLAPAAPPREPPPAAWIEAQLAHLGQEPFPGDAAGREALRGVLAGPILVDEVSLACAPRPVWQGVLTWLRPAGRAALAADTGATDPPTVVLDFWQPRPRTETLMDQVWALSQEGQSGREIARRLHLSTAWVSTLLKKAQKRYAAATPAVRTAGGPSGP